jgi:hypothetical protein
LDCCRIIDPLCNGSQSNVQIYEVNSCMLSLVTLPTSLVSQLAQVSFPSIMFQLICVCSLIFSPTCQNVTEAMFGDVTLIWGPAILSNIHKQNC